MPSMAPQAMYLPSGLCTPGSQTHLSNVCLLHRVTWWLTSWHLTMHTVCT